MSGKTDQDAAWLIEGVLTELQVATGKQNLLAQIDRHYKSNSVVTGLGAVVGELYGQAAGAAGLAMYDGEDTEHFICLIGEQVVCGTFAGASKLPVGKHVRAVVRRHGAVLKAEGILSESEGNVWLRHAWGPTAEIIANLKIAAWIFLAGVLFVSLYVFFISNNPDGDKLERITSMAWPFAVVGCGMAAWSSFSMRSLSSPATDTFRLLGFANPGTVNLNRYQYGIVHIHEIVQNRDSREHYGNIHCYQKAIDDGKIKMVSPKNTVTS